MKMKSNIMTAVHFDATIKEIMNSHSQETNYNEI